MDFSHRLEFIVGEVAANRFHYSIHGLCVNLTCDVPRALAPISKALGGFTISTPSAGIGAVNGSIRPYDANEVVRHLSPTATRLAGTSELVEIYEENERFWLIDDRWGLCELNVLKGQFRSWVLGESAAMKDTYRMVEQAVLWPGSQMLRRRGGSLAPAAGGMRAGVGASAS